MQSNREINKLFIIDRTNIGIKHGVISRSKLVHKNDD